MEKYIDGLVSVVMPTYKRSEKLFRAIDSVLNQSYRNLELLLVNDNDPNDDNTKLLKKRVEKYKNDPIFHLILQERHINGAVARNVGINNAKGEYIAFCISVQEADNIDRVGAYRLYETLEAVQFSKQPLEVQMQYVDSMLQTLNEYASYTCTTKTAQALWLDRIQFQMDYFERLKDQLKISTAL